MPYSIARLLAVTMLSLCSLVHAADRQLPGRVIRVVDGDSFILEVRGGQYRIELSGIDAPELNQPWGRTAADRLYGSLSGTFVVVTGATPAGDGAIVGSVTHRDRDVALDLIHDGLAWSTIHPATARTDSRPYPVAESRARLERRGLWSDDTPIPPWEWRRRRPGGFD